MRESEPAGGTVVPAAIRNVQALGLKVQPDRPVVNVRFEAWVPTLTRYEYKTDTVVIPVRLVETAAHAPEHPAFHGLILHEFGHRDTGPPDLVGQITGKALSAVLAALIALLAFMMRGWMNAWIAASLMMVLLGALVVANLWRIEYRCDDYMARHGGQLDAHSMLAGMVVYEQEMLASLPWWMRPLIQVRGRITHPPTWLRVRRHTVPGIE